MGHAAGQLPDGLHLHGLAQLIFELFALGDVLLDGHIVGDLMARIADRSDRGMLPEQVAILLAITQLSLPYPA